jgi:protein-tyrosine phosphatase
VRRWKSATRKTSRRVLFVCTGNIFRSLTADVALRGLLAHRADIAISSAGTDDYPHVVRPRVRNYLLTKGFDVSSHQRRTVTQALVDESALVVAMSTDHQAFIRERFRRHAPLFLEACGEPAAWLPDIEEIVSDWETNKVAVEAHVRMTIDRIVVLAPRMAANIDALIERYDPGQPTT